jgi:hypothetical protein
VGPRRQRERGKNGRGSDGGKRAPTGGARASAREKREGARPGWGGRLDRREAHAGRKKKLGPGNYFGPGKKGERRRARGKRRGESHWAAGWAAGEGKREGPREE